MMLGKMYVLLLHSIFLSASTSTIVEKENIAILYENDKVHDAQEWIKEFQQ